MTDKARAELAPTGILRAGINLSNFLLVTGRTEKAEPVGVAPDVAKAIAAEFDAEPRKAWPSTPSSVAMRNNPSALEPANRLCWPYCVGGMSSQANKVRLTSVIFMVPSSFGERKDGSPRVRFAPEALQYRLPA